MQRLRVVAITYSTIAIVGCGGTYDASVKGVVTLNGSPLARGTVKFIPEGAGSSAYGQIEGDGSYSMMTGREAGLPSGSYAVTIVANEASTPSSNPAAPPTPGKPITPAWYRDQASTPLKQKVEPGKNTINLELTLQPPAGWKPGKRGEFGTARNQENRSA